MTSPLPMTPSPNDATPGRIVHYVNVAPEHLPAIVLFNNGGGVLTLVVFGDRDYVFPRERKPGIEQDRHPAIVISYVNYDDRGMAGTWHWPERVEVKSE